MASREGIEARPRADAPPLLPETGAKRACAVHLGEHSRVIARNQQGDLSPMQRVEVYAYALGPSPAEEGVAGHLAEAFLVDVPALGEAIWQSGLKF